MKRHSSTHEMTDSVDAEPRRRRCTGARPRPLPEPGGDGDCTVRVTEPGSYVAHRSIVGQAGRHGVVVECEGVTIDLGGHEVLGVPGSLSGIVVRAGTGAVIRGGTVRGWGAIGIDAAQGPCSHVEALRCIDNGGSGLRLGASGSADSVTACDNGGAGIDAGPGCTLHDCQAFSNASHGIACEETCRVIDSSATANSGDGCVLGAGSQARACAAVHNLGSGFVAGALSSVIECDAIGNELDGVCAGNQCVVSRCRSHGSRKGAGIRATGQGTRVDENTCAENRVGILADRGGNIITRNAVSACAEAAIDAAPGNRVARLVASSESLRGEVGWSNFVL